MTTKTAMTAIENTSSSMLTFDVPRIVIEMMKVTTPVMSTTQIQPGSAGKSASI
jgi:hypothetical protein